MKCDYTVTHTWPESAPRRVVVGGAAEAVVSAEVKYQCSLSKITDFSHFMLFPLEYVKLSEELFRLKVSHFLFPSHENDPA